MMKIEKLRNGRVRARGTLDLITGDLEVRIEGPKDAWERLFRSPVAKSSSLRKEFLRKIFLRDVILPVLSSFVRKGEELTLGPKSLRQR